MWRSVKDDAAALKGLRHVFRTLSSRNYRLFFSGQGISLIGTWIQRVALSWLVYRLTGSEVLLGVVGFLEMFPIFILSSFGGVLADRVNRLRLLITTQVLALVQALILGLLVLTGLIQIWHIIVLAGLLGVINAVDMPVRQALTVELIDRKEDLGNAIALNSAMFNAARLVGPSVAGILIALLGEGPCFLINALSFLAVIVSLARMTLTRAAPERRPQNAWQGVREGFRYAFGFPPIRSVLLLLMVVSLTAMPYVVLMPVFAKDVLHGGAHTLGFLMGAAGGGALAGAIFLASRRSIYGLENILPAMIGLLGLGLIGFALSGTEWLSLVLLFVTGFGMMVGLASSNTIVQTVVDEDKRGRVMGLYATCFLGTMPFGSLAAGALAAAWGAPTTILLGGGCCLAGALLFSGRLPGLRRLIRAAYADKGITP
jgi:MFS family permease